MNAKELGSRPAQPTNIGNRSMGMQGGLTKREAFAMAAMQGMAMRVTGLLDSEVAYHARALADAMLAELAKDQP